MTETEFKLAPASAEVSAGRVTVTIRNAGATVHALEIENGGPGAKDLRSASIKPGASATITAQLQAGKRYVWYCPIANHKALGMKGTLTVGGGSANPGSSGGSGGAGTGSSTGGGGY
ncbi:MAG TPA: cupredoxin domain-containing protein [Solirubrobacteraceae bacterium]|nr:cupredoxin domain-containing protein [Solirubrobacteraceae bacterium]